MTCLIFLLKLLHRQILKKKRMTGCAARNVISDTTEYALVQKTRGNSFATDATDQNCNTK